MTLQLTMSMSIFNSLRTSVTFIKKSIISNAWTRTVITGNSALCVENTTENSENIEFEIERPSISTCLQYMKSKAYENTYGNKPVWHIYVRNFKGALPPKTRRTCTNSNGRVLTGSPCPICRDIYLLPHYLNIDLLNQFISPHGGYIIDSRVTGVCQKQQLKLEIAIAKARNYGLLTFYVPFRYYNYKFYQENK